MKILIVASNNKNRYAPFIQEQAEALQHAGCKIEWFGIQGKGVVGYLKAIPKLSKKINECKPDVIHAHYGLSCLLANLATRKIPVVSTYHGSDINERIGRKFSCIAMWLSAWNIFVSQRNVNIARPRKCWSLIPCGVAMSEVQLLTRAKARKALGWEYADKKVLFAGAFDNGIKDSALACSVMERLAKSDERLANTELIELKGYSREEVNTLMCAANCLLMTSKTEGSPQVIKEAMACGCPIVSVDVGDVAERTSGVDGCYVISSREPKDIAAALEKAIEFDGKTTGRERIIKDGLSNELIAKRIIEIYENII